jgi:hypothetical protein
MQRHDTFSRAFVMTLTLLACAFGAAHVCGQGKQAVLVLRQTAGGAGESGCDGSVEINHQIAYDVKLNNEDEVRLLAGLRPDGNTSVSRKEYEASGKSKLKDLYALAWGRDGALYGVSSAGQTPIAALPGNMKPQKNADTPLSNFYSVMLSGEARDGKQKRKLNLTLREIWKVYFIPEGGAVNDTLFRHAFDEKSVALWEAYLKRTNNYRGGEANAFMRDALVACARNDLETFAKGDYDSLDKARRRAGRAQAVRDDDLTKQLALSITQAQQKVDGARNQIEQLIRADRWDDAIDAAEPIKIYLGTWPDLDKMYSHALKQSHEIHLFKGKEALRGSLLEEARSNCTTAWKRLPASADARECVCESRNQIALRDSLNQRRQKRPREAKELLEAQQADADCPRDSRIASALRESNCEYSQQLLAESRQLVVGGGGAAPQRTTGPARPAAGRRAGRAGAARAAASPNPLPAQPTPLAAVNVSLKSITAQNKKEFRDAHAKLTLASQLCPDEAVRVTLLATSRRLAEFCLEEARKAFQRGHFGTAYVYLQTAQGYTPGDGSMAESLGQARERFQQQTRVNVGVVMENSAQSRVGDQVLNEVAAAVESVVSRAGLSQAIVLDRREAANALRVIQSNRDLSGPSVVFSGDLVGASIRRSDDPRVVRSSYSYSNPRWEAADRIHDDANADYKRCVKQSGEAACGNLRDRVSALRAARDQHQRNVTEYYSYRETLIRIEGGLRMSFRATDSVSRSTRAAETLEAAVSRQCVQREGTHPKDFSARDAVCDIGDEQSYLFQMIEKLKGDSYSIAVAQLGQLPLSYYERARTATNRQQGVEDYLRYLFLTKDKNGNEAREATNAVVAFDPELSTDAVMR